MTKNQNFQSINSQALSGIANIPGDKSISHRSLIIASLSIGITKIFKGHNC